MREVFLNEGFQITPSQEELFRKYLDLLLKSPVNVTSIRDPREIVYRHFIDSLQLLKVLDLREFASLMDVGTGGGFPGIPLKILSPHIKLYLLEASKRKVIFLRDLLKALGLNEVEVLEGRAEELARDSRWREKLDLVVSRAVAPLNVLLELTLPFLREGGIAVAYKGKGVFEEIERAKNALSVLGGSLEEIREYHIRGIDFNGVLLFIKKERRTPDKYPRRPGIPSKRPL